MIQTIPYQTGMGRPVGINGTCTFHIADLLRLTANEDRYCTTDNALELSREIKSYDRRIHSPSRYLPSPNYTRKPCCRKETARCRKCSFPLKFDTNIHYKYKKD